MAMSVKSALALIDAIKAKTDNLPSDTAAEIVILMGMIDGNNVYEFTFDVEGKNTGGKKYIYDSKANANNHIKGGGLQTGGLLELTLSATYDVDSQPDVVRKVIEP